MRIGMNPDGTKITAIAIDDAGRDCFRQRMQRVYEIEAVLAPLELAPRGLFQGYQ